MTKAKIIHLITRLEPGGSSQNTIDSCIFQSKRFQVMLARGPCEKEPENLPLKLCLIPHLRREINFFCDLLAFVEIYQLLAREKPDILHTHTSKAGALGRLAAAFQSGGSRGRKVLVVHTPHGHVFYGYFGKIKSMLFILAEKFLSRFTSCLIALSKGEKQESLTFGIKGRWEVVHSGVTLKRGNFTDVKTELGLRGKTVGTVARLEKVKGVEYLIRAANIIKNSGVSLEFLIVGDGHLRKKLEKLSTKLNVNEIIKFVGFQNEVFKYIAAMDIYVQPSLNEGLGRSIIEAQYLGKPVIAFSVCGIKDLVVHGRNGFLIKPGDFSVLAEHIKIMAGNEVLRKNMGEYARKFVRQKDNVSSYSRFSVESMNIKLEILYNKILAERRDNAQNISSRR